MIKQTLLILAAGAALAAPCSYADVANMNALFEAKKSLMNSHFDSQRQVQDDKFEQAKKAYRDSFQKAQARYADIWENPAMSSANKWVVYSNDKRVRRTVDFESGEYTVEILGAKNQAEVDGIIRAQTRELSSATVASAVAKDPVLSQISSQKVYEHKRVLPNTSTASLIAKKRQTQFEQPNGQTVTKVSMAFPKDALSQRGLEYVPEIEKQANKWQVDPVLMMAIMHTESHFNPVAQSHIPAYGLMQIVPTTAGKDVTRLHMGQERLLQPSELFDANYNIEVGAAYLNILDARYLKGIQDPTTRMYIAISSYNGGVGSVAKHFTGTGSLKKLASHVNGMKPQRVYHSLAHQFPFEETRNYIQKVEAKRQFYAPYF
ncbi:transglycosylase SLT domain-containing protein [Enterovibrio calviensis]|uniref:transglycosylase SLT domain-containing protein n=1 Tax=Enterovibrio calviensis TaxID=91359 RepID=UPI00373503D0